MRKPCHRSRLCLRSAAAAFALAAACLLGPAPSAYAEDGQNAQLTLGDYATLGLAVSEDIPNDLTNEPLSKTKKSSLLTKSEIYVSANGVNGNTFILRDLLSNPQGKGDISTNLSSDYGAIAGAHGLWSSLRNYDNGTIRDTTKYGGGTSSFLSSNADDTILSKGDAGFSGLYATSVAFSWNSGTDAKDNYVAELRAYGETASTTIDGTKYAGAVGITIYRFDDSGKTRTKVCDLSPSVRPEMIYDGKEFKYIKAGYLQEWDAAFEIEAADVDGDGADELFCYVGAYRDADAHNDGNIVRQALVNMFKQDGAGGWTAYEYFLDAGLASDYNTSYTGWSNEDNDAAWGQLQSCPVVTIAAGDLDMDFKEDVAITVSAPQNKSNVNSAACEIFTWNGSDLTRVDIDGAGGRIGLAAADGKAMVSANCAFGTFAAYDAEGVKTGNCVTGLVIAGWESFDSRAHYGDDSSYSNNHPYTNAAYRYVYYDMEKGAYVISDYQSVSLEKNAKEIARRASVHNPEHRRYACTLAPFALATADLKGLERGSEPLNEALLFGGDIYENFACTVNGSRPGLNNCTGHISMCTDDRYNASNSNHDKSIEQVWIGDVAVGVVSDATTVDADGNKTPTYGESFLAVVGTHRNEDLRKDDDYYWMTLSHFTRVNGENKTGEEEIICESHRRSNNTYGTYVSLALPDVDKDGVSVTYQDQYKMYTNPEVYAVLQDAPYYEDLQDSFGYLVLGGTGFGQSSSSETSDTNAVDVSLAGSLTASEGFIEKFEGSIAVGAGFGYEYMQSTEVGYSLTYDSHAGEGDKAVIYTLPVLCYVYDVTDEAAGNTEQLVAPVSLGLETSVVSLETYDEVARAHGLASIGDALMQNSSGLPKTYQGQYGSNDDPQVDSFGLGTSSSDENVSISVGRSYTAGGAWAGANNNTGASTTSSIEVGKSEANSYEGSLFLNVDASFGFAFLQNEALLGFIADGGLSTSLETVSSEGLEFSGTVDNFPKQAEGYGFQWRLGVNRAEVREKVAGEGYARSFWVVGYDVRDVQTPSAPAVTGFAATAATSDSVSFSWNDVLPKDSPYSYGIGMLRDNDSDKISASDYRAVPAGTTEYTWKGDELLPNTSYHFVIAAIHEDENGVAKPVGIRSAIVEVKTMPEGWTFVVYGPDADPDGGVLETPALLQRDDSAAKVEGDSLSLAAYGVVKLADGTNADKLSYTWHRKLRGETEWSPMGGTHETGASVLQVGENGKLSAKDDGSLYKCTVGYGSVAIDTGVIRVDVSEREEASQPVSSEHRRHPMLKRLSHFAGGTGVSTFALRSGYSAVVDYGDFGGNDPAPNPAPGSDPALTPSADGSTAAASAKKSGQVFAPTADSSAPFALGALSLGAAAVVAAFVAAFVAARRIRRSRRGL